MNDERVIVYIDEETDDGMMWEELNQTGKMQVSVYDEEFESWSEFHHSIKVKSLQEYLAEHDKQVRKEIIEKIKWLARAKGIFGQSCKDMNYIQFNDILDQIQGE